MELGDQECSDAILLQYGIEPLYHDCGARFSIRHYLDCKKGGLITSSHNELRDGVADLDIKSLTPTHMRKNLFIKPGCAVQSGKAL